jgi:hypothetical protein
MSGSPFVGVCDLSFVAIALPDHLVLVSPSTVSGLVLGQVPEVAAHHQGCALGHLDVS